jgi:DNA polymerase/3'-5' exonuclease PolX
MELENAPGQRVWAYRKAAWAIEDLEQHVRLVYRQMGRKGLDGIRNVGPHIAGVVEASTQKGLRPTRHVLLVSAGLQRFLASWWSRVAAAAQSDNRIIVDCV